MSVIVHWIKGWEMSVAFRNTSVFAKPIRPWQPAICKCATNYWFTFKIFDIPVYLSNCFTSIRRTILRFILPTSTVSEIILWTTIFNSKCILIWIDHCGRKVYTRSPVHIEIATYVQLQQPWAGTCTNLKPQLDNHFNDSVLLSPAQTHAGAAVTSRAGHENIPRLAILTPPRSAGRHSQTSYSI